jgi:hypothetical protein
MRASDEDACCTYTHDGCAGAWRWMTVSTTWNGREQHSKWIFRIAPPCTDRLRLLERTGLFRDIIVTT